MDCSTSGFPVHHQLPELTQTLAHWVGDAIQPSNQPSIAYLKDYSVAITFIYTGRKKILGICFIMIFALLWWSKTKSTISLWVCINMKKWENTYIPYIKYAYVYIYIYIYIWIFSILFIRQDDAKTGVIRIWLNEADLFEVQSPLYLYWLIRPKGHQNSSPVASPTFWCLPQTQGEQAFLFICSVLLYSRPKRINFRL